MTPTLDAAEAIIFSDIHLVDEADPRSHRLIALLRSLENSKPRTLIFLGDIFDFCFGGGTFFRERFAYFNTELQKLIAKKHEVIFFEGNHEFFLAELPWPKVRFVSSGSWQMESGGKRFVFQHGDDLGPSTSYRLFRALVKSPFIYWVAKHLVPGSLLNRYALAHSQVSRASDKYREVDVEKLYRLAEAWVRQEGTEIGIFGHYHLPIAEKRAGVEFYCVDSWFKPSVLAITKGVVERVYL